MSWIHDIGAHQSPNVRVIKKTPKRGAIHVPHPVVVQRGPNGESAPQLVEKPIVANALNQVIPAPPAQMRANGGAINLAGGGTSSAWYAPVVTSAQAYKDAADKAVNDNPGFMQSSGQEGGGGAGEVAGAAIQKANQDAMAQIYGTPPGPQASQAVQPSYLMAWTTDPKQFANATDWYNAANKPDDQGAYSKVNAGYQAQVDAKGNVYFTDSAGNTVSPDKATTTSMGDTGMPTWFKIGLAVIGGAAALSAAGIGAGAAAGAPEELGIAGSNAAVDTGLDAAGNTIAEGAPEELGGGPAVDNAQALSDQAQRVADDIQEQASSGKSPEQAANDAIKTASQNGTSQADIAKGLQQAGGKLDSNLLLKAAGALVSGVGSLGKAVAGGIASIVGGGGPGGNGTPTTDGSGAIDLLTPAALASAAVSTIAANQAAGRASDAGARALDLSGQDQTQAQNLEAVTNNTVTPGYQDLMAKARQGIVADVPRVTTAAHADVQASIANEKQQLLDYMAKNGINPNSPAGLSMMNQIGMSGSATDALSQTNARTAEINRADTLGMTNLTNAVNAGSQFTSGASSMSSNATNATNVAGNINTNLAKIYGDAASQAMTAAARAAGATKITINNGGSSTTTSTGSPGTGIGAGPNGGYDLSGKDVVPSNTSANGVTYPVDNNTDQGAFGSVTDGSTTAFAHGGAINLSVGGDTLQNITQQAPSVTNPYPNDATGDVRIADGANLANGGAINLAAGGPAKQKYTVTFTGANGQTIGTGTVDNTGSFSFAAAPGSNLSVAQIKTINDAGTAAASGKMGTSNNVAVSNDGTQATSQNTAGPANTSGLTPQANGGYTDSAGNYFYVDHTSGQLVAGNTPPGYTPPQQWYTDQGVQARPAVDLSAVPGAGGGQWDGVSAASTPTGWKRDAMNNLIPDGASAAEVVNAGNAGVTNAQNSPIVANANRIQASLASWLNDGTVGNTTIGDSKITKNADGTATIVRNGQSTTINAATPIMSLYNSNPDLATHWNQQFPVSDFTSKPSGAIDTSAGAPANYPGAVGNHIPAVAPAGSNFIAALKPSTNTTPFTGASPFVAQPTYGNDNQGQAAPTNHIPAVAPVQPPASTAPTAPAVPSVGAIDTSSSGGAPSDSGGAGSKPPMTYNTDNTVTSWARNGGAISLGGARFHSLAEGGPIRGAGTGTSDSIKTMSNAGDYIIPADVVRAKGIKFFNKLLEDCGIQPGNGAKPGGDQRTNLSNGEYRIPEQVVNHYGTEFFDKLRAQYHHDPAPAHVLPHHIHEAIRLHHAGR